MWLGVLDILLDTVFLREKNLSFTVSSCVSLLLKASMREQETAATVQDVEVQRMELESQRQLFEQVVIRERCRRLYLIVLPWQFSDSVVFIQPHFVRKKGGFFFFPLSDTFFRINPLLIRPLVELTVICFSGRKYPCPPHFILLLCRGIIRLLQGLAVCSAG